MPSELFDLEVKHLQFVSDTMVVMICTDAASFSSSSSSLGNCAIRMPVNLNAALFDVLSILICSFTIRILDKY